MLKRPAIAVFVKTPGLSPIKTRLARTIGQQEAEKYYLQFIKKTEQVLYKLEANGFKAFWAVTERQGMQNVLWQNFSTIYSGIGNSTTLGNRLHRIYSDLLRKYSPVVLIGADTPQIDSDQIIDAIRPHYKKDSFIIGPSIDGGFYLIAGSKKIPGIFWRYTTYSKNSTYYQLTRKLKYIGKLKKISPLCDIDTEDDLLQLTKTTPGEYSTHRPFNYKMIGIRKL
jgi:glycosyltransferase A (GT-A) superfamily protein (DUF2064 family)